MPTYKSEFLHHHYRSLRQWRPTYAYAFGYIDKAARLASLMPELANLVGLRRCPADCIVDAVYTSLIRGGR